MVMNNRQYDSAQSAYDNRMADEAGFEYPEEFYDENGIFDEDAYNQHQYDIEESIAENRAYYAQDKYDELEV